MWDIIDSLYACSTLTWNDILGKPKEVISAITLASIPRFDNAPLIKPQGNHKNCVNARMGCIPAEPCELRPVLLRWWTFASTIESYYPSVHTHPSISHISEKNTL